MAALVITPEIEAAAQKLAEATGQTPADAVVGALRLQLLKTPVRASRDEARLDDILKELHALPVDHSLTEDEILGYDAFGVPKQPYLDR